MYGSSSKAIDFLVGCVFFTRDSSLSSQRFSLYLFGLLCCFLCRGARIDSAKQESRTD
ncbi:hypothetical protein Peur_037960 [Populus x canadensis]